MLIFVAIQIMSEICRLDEEGEEWIDNNDLHVARLSMELE